MRLALYIFLAVLGLSVAVVGTLVFTGNVTLPWARPAARDGLAKGWIAVPMSARPIHAYARVTRDDLINSDTGKPYVIPMQADRLPNPSPILSNAQILNRVIRRDKEPGYTFHDDDFFPAGTLPGPAAGVPPGKRAITLDAAKVSGVRDRAAGDHVNLVASQMFDTAKMRSGSLLPSQLGTVMAKVVDVHVLAQDAVVVTPLTVRQVPYMTSGSMTSTAQVRTRPVEEVTLAMDPSEVTGVARATGLEANIACVLRSGQPATRSSAPAPYVSDESDAKKFAVVDQIVGSKHVVRLVPTAKMVAGGASPAAGDQP